MKKGERYTKGQRGREGKVLCDHHLGEASSICATTCVPLTVTAVTEQGCICGR